MAMIAGPIPVRVPKGHSTPPTADVHLEPLTISDDLEELFHRNSASSDVIEHLKEADMEAMPEGSVGNLDGSIRVMALRCMSHMLQAFTSGHSHWFKAAILLDRFIASSSFRLEQLPLTCVCVARIVSKCDASATNYSAPFFASERCSVMKVIKDFGTWLETSQNCVTSELSDRALHLHEQTVLKALDWQVNYPCVEQWCFVYFTRFGLLAGREFQASIQHMQAKVLMFARAMVMCFPTTREMSHGQLAAGLFGLSFVDAGLLPMASLKPSKVSMSEWSQLFAATQPRGELPQCRLPPAMTTRIMDMVCLAVSEEPDSFRTAAGRAAESLGETFRQIHNFQVERGA